jgi:DNA-binding CsgD family transcriptional regulator
MVLSHEVQTYRVSPAAFGEAVLSVAAARSPDALGTVCHRQIQSLTGSASLGIYSRATGTPKLVFSREASEGFLSEYDTRTSRGDVLIDRICDQRRAIDGYTTFGPAAWRSSGREELMRRWGYAHCMVGPLCVEQRVVGAIYVTSTRQTKPYSEPLLERMSFLCRAASIALANMFDAGLAVEDADGAWKEPSAAETSRMVQLPPRSRQVAGLVARGLSNKEIARDLALSVHTIKEYVGNLCKRFEAQNRTELVRRLLTS